MSSYRYECVEKIENNCPLKFHIQHGTDRIEEVTKLAGFDVVLTTYDTLNTDIKNLFALSKVNLK